MIRRVLAAASIAAAVLAAPASASFPGHNGRIFFSSVRKDGSFEIFSMRGDGSGVSRLTNVAPLGSRPAWSPDGKKLAFVVRTSDTDGELLTMNRDATGRALVARGVAPYAGVSWSPDGRRIAFVCPTGRYAVALCLVRSDGSHRRRITRWRKSQTDPSPTWSPDGKQLVFVENHRGAGRRDVHRLLALNLRTGHLRVIMRTTNFLDSPAWSRTGWIAYDRSRDGESSDVYVIRGDGRGNRNVTRTRDSGEWEPSWSPDGRRLVFTAYDDGEHLFVIDADGTDRQRLSFALREDGYGNPVHPSWSPDGEQIALDDDFGGIWLVRPDGSDPKAAMRGDAHVTPAVTADGSTVAFVGQNDFFLMDSNGANVRTAWGGDNPSWSPDGRRVAVEDDDAVWLINVDGSGEELIAEDEGIGDPANWDPAWSPDGKNLAWVVSSGGDGGGDIYALSLETRKEGFMTIHGTEDEPAWSPDGKRLAFDEGNGIALISVDHGHFRKLVPNASHPAWSPDGKKIAFVRFLGKNSEIYVVNVDGTGLKRLTNNPGPDLSPDWQAVP